MAREVGVYSVSGWEPAVADGPDDDGKWHARVPNPRTMGGYFKAKFDSKAVAEEWVAEKTAASAAAMAARPDEEDDGEGLLEEGGGEDSGEGSGSPVLQTAGGGSRQIGQYSVTGWGKGGVQLNEATGKWDASARNTATMGGYHRATFDTKEEAEAWYASKKGDE